MTMTYPPNHRLRLAICLAVFACLFIVSTCRADWVKLANEQLAKGEISQRVLNAKLISNLHTGRGIQFNDLFYGRYDPEEAKPQAHSLAVFLIQKHGMATWLKHQGKYRNYGYRDLHQLQRVWLDWVRTWENQANITEFQTVVLRGR